MNVDERIIKIRDTAIIRNIDLVNQLITLKDRLKKAKTSKKIAYYQDKIDYIEESIYINYDIIMQAADIERKYFYEN